MMLSKVFKLVLLIYRVNNNMTNKIIMTVSHLFLKSLLFDNFSWDEPKPSDWICHISQLYRDR